MDDAFKAYINSEHIAHSSNQELTDYGEQPAGNTGTGDGEKNDDFEQRAKVPSRLVLKERAEGGGHYWVAEFIQWRDAQQRILPLVSITRTGWQLGVTAGLYATYVFNVLPAPPTQLPRSTTHLVTA